MRQIFLNLPEKFLCDKLSPHRFQVAVGTLCFLYQVATDLKVENLVFESWLLIT